MSIAFGYTVSSCLWTLFVTAILTVVLLLLKHRILALHSGFLLKALTMIIMVGVSLPMYFTKAPASMVERMVDTFPVLQSGMLYRMDYHIQDM